MPRIDLPYEWNGMLSRPNSCFYPICLASSMKGGVCYFSVGLWNIHIHAQWYRRKTISSPFFPSTSAWNKIAANQHAWCSAAAVPHYEVSGFSFPRVRTGQKASLCQVTTHKVPLPAPYSYTLARCCTCMREAPTFLFFLFLQYFSLS